MIEAFNFILRTLTNRKAAVAERPALIQKSSHTFEVTVFYQSNTNRTKGTIIVVNGFSVYGDKDERTLSVARNMASLGYTVVAPRFSMLNRLIIHPQLVSDIQTFILALVADSRLCPQGKVSVFAPSFSAGMFISACADKSIGPFVKTIFSVGTYVNIEESIRFVIHSNDVDDYGRNVLLYNFLHLTPHFSERLLHVVKTAIEDNGFKRKEPLLPEVLKSLTSDEMNFWEKYTHDFRFRENFLEDAFNRVPDRTAWKNAFDILPKVQDILSYIILIHGKNDNVIPASESLALYKQLIAYNKPTYLCISPVLDHGDVQKNLTAYLDFFKILKAFSIFFRLAGNNQ